jgi:D-alanyl-D-alanine carboxypeptidase
MRQNSKAAWLNAALAYVPNWLAFQVERHRQVGCTVAIARGSKLIDESAFGVANIDTNEPLTSRHRFRVASHSKSFTAAGIMKLREMGKIGLDDSVGRYVSGLHKGLAQARISELLSHSAGVIRDGADSGQFIDTRPYLSRNELLAELAKKQPLKPGLQLKYSNHGYGLLGFVIEEITGESYLNWITEHVIEAAGLTETAPDIVKVPKKAVIAKGHSGEWPIGQRVIIPGDNPTHAIAPAAGFVSTAADLVRFFSQLAPESKTSFLSPASRREMIHRRWRDEHSTLEQHYGYGIMSGGAGARRWFGHTGALQGFISRTAHYPETGITISVLCHALDGLAYPWVEGIANIIQTFHDKGPPDARLTDWSGRWWTMWGVTDIVPMGDRLYGVVPGMFPPFDEGTSELAVTGQDVGTILKASAFGSPGEPVRRVRNKEGRIVELWIGGVRLLEKEAVITEMKRLYGAPPAAIA